MLKSLPILLLLALIIALPFALRRQGDVTAYTDADPVLVIVTPHNEAIRHEFARGFERWRAAHGESPVKIEWRNVGGTTEIARFLTSEYAASMRVYWTRELNRDWPAGATDSVTGNSPPADPALRKIFDTLRSIDDPDSVVNCKIDVLFGGGEYDHSDAAARGLTVPPWAPGQEPRDIFYASDGTLLLPREMSGETWRTATLFGNAISTFGICYNFDRLNDLGFKGVPDQWDDLANPLFFRQVGVADPDKSGSVAKAFEMIIHQKMHQAVIRAGYTPEQIQVFEDAIGAYAKSRGRSYRRGEAPADVPQAYERALEAGWVDGLHLVQLIGANARYFTDSSQKVPIDVSVGDAAVGMSIDFFGRYQAQLSRSAQGKPRMAYVTPTGGSSVSCDPVSLLRGAGGHARPEKRAMTRRVAIEFIRFVLSEDGQKLWTYRVGTPGGPDQYALRRLPIRRDFYPSTNPVIQAKHLEHLKYAADDLSDPTIDPYTLAKKFIYHRRWTGSHFNVQRRLIRAMCIDAGQELRDAWAAINDPANAPNRAAALAQLGKMPSVMLTNRQTGQVERVELNWRTATDVLKTYDPLEVMRQWTIFFIDSYDRAKEIARHGAPGG